MGLVLMAIAAATASHSVQIEHRGAPMEAIYSARTDIRTRTIGAHTPNRADTRRCRWIATVVVERRLAHSPALARTLPGEHHLSGNLPGECAPNAVERAVARHADSVQEHVVAMAGRDRAPLLAELDSIKNLASR